MKHRKLTYTALALLLGLTACTQDEQMTEGVEGTPITFTATGLNFDEAHTRATVDNNWDGVTKVAVKIGNVTKEYDVEITDETNKTTATLTSTDPFHWKSSTPIVVTAWPYTGAETPNDLPSVTVQEDQSTEENFKLSDFIMAEQTVTYGSTTLNFTHRTARISVTLTPTDSNKDIDATVKLNGLTNGESTTEIITKKSATPNVYEALVPPQTIAAEQLTISVTLNGETFHYNFDDGITYEAGKRYNYTLSINNNSLKFEGSTITDWEETAFANDYVIRADGTYVVYTPKGLYAWADATKANPATSCVLANNITLPEVPEGESNWEPVATDMLNGYTGTFDGNNHAITGVTINLPDSTMVGFFGCVGRGGAPAGLVKNLTLEAVNIKGGEFMTAGIIAAAAQTSIQNCSTSGDIEGTGGYVGGVTGYCVYSNVTTCHSNANIQNLGKNETEPSTGGIAAANNYGKITDCHFNQGEIKGRKNTGGIVGQNVGFITACHSSGVVEGDTCIGGVAGYGGIGWVIACYSTGTIKGKSKTGGIAGETGEGLTAACYFTGTVTGETNIGAVVGVRHKNGTYYSCYWSGNTGLNGVGSGGTGEVAKIEGDTSWQTATSEMNKDINYLNNEHDETLGQIEWMYICTDENTPPTLQKTAE